ncbi:universal stress protein [Ramlibacter henchirensis]|uniref:Universal stress protein n=1 Tax=Ramlibacter henchirensis TaxID=204072 RepID=A0A4Z0C6R2_9BURK|nr:universal stress protein [Ramlibacter henchirensis]TFZ06160.1 universal stress protein [Ramlibacter henchirensis]
MSRPFPRGATGAAHVLALCDLSPASMNAAWRAAIVSRDLQVPMRLLYRCATPITSEVPAAVASFIGEAARRHDVAVTPIGVHGDPVAECVSLAKKGLLVLATPNGNPLGEWLMGSPAERLIRLVRAPVLVVKQPARDSYRRVFAPVDLLACSDHLVAQGAALAGGHGVAVFHALAPADELVLHEIDAPPQALRAHRQERASWASSRMERLVDSACSSEAHGARRESLAPIVAFGNAAHTILAGETAHKAELIVIGKRRRGLLADFLLGSVTRQVLARSEADVLVVPLPTEGAADD